MVDYSKWDHFNDEEEGDNEARPPICSPYVDVDGEDSDEYDEEGEEEGEEEERRRKRRTMRTTSVTNCLRTSSQLQWSGTGLW